MDFLERYWWVFVVAIVFWELSKRQTVQVNAGASTSSTSQTQGGILPIAPPTRPGVGAGGGPVKPRAPIFNEDSPGYDSLGGIVDDPSWGDEG